MSNIDWTQKKTPADILAERRAAASMSRRDFAITAQAQGWITAQEAEEWVSGAAVPALVTNVITAQLAAGAIPAEDEVPLRIDVRSQPQINRTDRLIPMLMAAQSVTDAQMDAVFGIT